MKKGSSKKAVALISLVVAIIALIMLSGLVTYASRDMIRESKKVAFANDTSAVYDAVEEYYAVNGDIPILEGGIVMNAATYKSNITNIDYSAALLEEFVNNGDENAVFYEIDMAKIGIKDSNYGVKATEKDIYLVSNVSHSVYYYPGRKINKEIYFSNTHIVNK